MSTLRRQARPSASCVDAPKERASVGSSTRTSDADGDLLAHPVGEQRTALGDRLARQRRGHHGEQGRGHPGIEHDGAAARARLGGAEHPGGALHGVGDGLVEVELARAPGGARTRPRSGCRRPPRRWSRPPTLAHRAPGRGGDPGRRGHGRFGRRCRRSRRTPPGGRRDPRCGPGARAPAPARPSPRSGVRTTSVVPQVERRRRHPVGVGQADVLVGAWRRWRCRGPRPGSASSTSSSSVPA